MKSLMMSNKSAPKSIIKLEPLRSPKQPLSASNEDLKLRNAVPAESDADGCIGVPQAKMLKKSASKALIKLEPLRSVDSRPSQRKSANETTASSVAASPAVTSLNEVSDNVLLALDELVKHLNSADTSSIAARILKMCKDLKSYGHILERKDSMQMNRYFVFLRDAAQDPRIDTVSRLRLLEIIELRASGWKGGDQLDMFYKNKIIELENVEPNLAATSPFNNSNNLNLNNGIQMSSSPTSFSPLTSLNISVANHSNSNILAPGEVMKSSGKYGKPAKIPSKNYYKDEIVIHNADSGKVMGIKGRRVHMIEELSGTIVSFQRVLPGAKDRLVQITGPTESAVAYAQQLIEETIVRNTSPIRDRPNPLQTSESASNLKKLSSTMDSGIRPSILHSMSMNDATLGEYQYTVNVGADLIKLACSRLDVIRTAKLVLEEYFAGDAKRTSHEPLSEVFTPSDDELLSSSPSPTNLLERPPLTRSVSYGGIVSSAPSTALAWGDRNGHRLSKAARITGRCVPQQATAANQDDSDDEEDDDEDEEEEEEEEEEDLRSAKDIRCRDKHRREFGRRIVYRREFILTCSRSPYSKSTPKCLAKIIQENPTILKKTADFFDPSTHSLSGSPVELASSRNWSQGSRGESQEVDDPE